MWQKQEASTKSELQIWFLSDMLPVSGTPFSRMACRGRSVFAQLRQNRLLVSQERPDFPKTIRQAAQTAAKE